MKMANLLQAKGSQKHVVGKRQTIFTEENHVKHFMRLR